MRTIRKSSEPVSLTQHRANRSEDFTPDYDNYAKKDDLRQSLCAEQRGLCCYCMRRIKPDAEHMKIEHCLSQSQYEDRQLDYSNLLGACMGGAGNPPASQHCDTRKGNRDLSFNPADPAVQIEHRLSYRPSDGSIASSDPTIDSELNTILNLNVAFLRENRKAVLDAFLATLGRRSLTREQVRKHIADWNGENGGSLREYCQVVIYWLQKKQK